MFLTFYLKPLYFGCLFSWLNKCVWCVCVCASVFYHHLYNNCSVFAWLTDSPAGSDDDEWTSVGPEAEHNWLNVSGLESGSEYEFRVVASNNGANKTKSEPTIIYVGERKGIRYNLSPSRFTLIDSVLISPACTRWPKK